MWTYTRTFLFIYLCISDILLTKATQNTEQLWAEIQEVTSDFLDSASRDKSPQFLFQPTSFLNPGYGVLFQHIGQLHQSVYKHYIIVALRIPNVRNVPHQPEIWYKGCQEALLKVYSNGREKEVKDTFSRVFHDDFCSQQRIKDLYVEATQLLHSTIPALLPNQVVPYADYAFYNISPAEMPVNEYSLNRTPRNKRSVDKQLPEISPIEIHRALDYFAKYGEPLPMDEDTIYADQLTNTTTPKRQKRFLGSLVRGISRIFKGANVFGKIVRGVKKIGGFIFKGIKGLFHRRKNTALTNAVRAFGSFGSKAKRFLLDKVYKFKKFKGLHLGRSSLSHTLRRHWHKFKFWQPTRFVQTISTALASAKESLREHTHTATDYQFEQRMHNLKHSIDSRFSQTINYANHLMSFLNYRQESIFYLEKTVVSLHTMIYGLEQLAIGRLTHTLIPPNVLHKYLNKALREIRIEHPQFVPLYTELHHYYESKMNSYTNDENYIYVQIPVFFTARNQPPLNLYRIHTVPVPLDKDTYDGKESKYTTIELEYPYLATNGEEYMDITQPTLDTCEVYHMDYLCENIHLTTDIQELTCAVSLYLDTTESQRWTPAQITTLIKQKCNITYHERLYPTPTTLQTQDEILLANFRTYNWQLLCDEISDRPRRFDGALYTIVNLDDLCTCAITTPLGRYLYESMRSCDKPDDKVTLYFTYNRPLISYDASIDPKTAKRYSKQPYPFRAPDLEYHSHEPYITPNGSLHTRLKRHTPTDTQSQQPLDAVSFPLGEAVRKMETGEPTYLGTLFPSSQPLAVMDSTEAFQLKTEQFTETEQILEQTNTGLVNLVFNVVTLINALVHCCLLISLKLSLRDGGWLHNTIIQIVQTVLTQKAVECVDLIRFETPKPTIPILDLRDTELDILLAPTTPAPRPLSEIDALHSMSMALLIVVAVVFGGLFIFFLVRYLILPCSYKSNLYRQLCVGCFQTSDPYRSQPITDVFLDIVHVQSGAQIRIFLATISAPACALRFTGNVNLHNFKINHKKFRLEVLIDWHNCLLLYNNFVLPLPHEGTAVIQPNLLTNFQLSGPYNVVLLARHLDQMIQVPHLEESDNLALPENKEIPNTEVTIPSPYDKVHAEVKALMPMAKSVASSSESESAIHIV